MEVDVLPVLACNGLGLTGAVGDIGMASFLILFLRYTTRGQVGKRGKGRAEEGEGVASFGMSMKSLIFSHNMQGQWM